MSDFRSRVAAEELAARARRSGELAPAQPETAPQKRRSTDLPSDVNGRMTAWQRWEMASVYAAEEAAAAEQQALREARERQQQMRTELETIRPPVLIDDAELERLRAAARRAGEEEGLVTGRERGYQEGYAAGAEIARQEAARFTALADALPRAMQKADTQISDDLISLAFDIARKVVQKTIEHRPEQIVTVVQELLQAEPALTGTPQLLVNEEDVMLIRKYFSEDIAARGWIMRAIPGITRGGCRVVAGTGELDATVESRYARVSAALGRRDVFMMDDLDVF